MRTIKINLKRKLDESYNVTITEGLLQTLPVHLTSLGSYERYVIITDSRVQKICGNSLLRHLRQHKMNTLLLAFEPGEKFKNQTTKTFLEERMLEAGCNKSTLIVALGGGIVGDMAAFVASTFMRGIPYVQVPTTILAMVDAALGGKAGINTRQGKNLIGAVWQPKQVFIDLDLVKQLPKEQKLNGYYEMVKVGVTSSKKLFLDAEKNVEAILNGNPKVWESLIFEALKVKAKIVEQDEKTLGDRQILNFGHTIGQALEVLSGYKIMHGYGVALGVIVESKISVLEGLLHHDDYVRIVELIKKTGIDLSPLKKWTPSQIIAAARKDKKTKGDKLKIVLIEGIGKLHRREGVAISPVSDRVIKRALKSIDI